MCGMDRYKATYHFLERDSFILKYDVIGPKKNYVIKTEFYRINEAV